MWKYRFGLLMTRSGNQALIIGGALIISGNPIALGLMSIAFIADFVVFFLRLYYPWPYNLHLLAGAWLIIAVTLGIVVARAVFGGGRITYHRIVRAILLYLLTAVTFATLFAFVGLSISDAFKQGRDVMSYSIWTLLRLL
jgi:hypothetical protein